MNRISITIILCLFFILTSTPSWGNESDTISVSVHLALVCVEFDTNTWNIGAITMGSIVGPESFNAINCGNVPIDMLISGTDGAGGWELENSASTNSFRVGITNPPMNLATLYDDIAYNVQPDEIFSFEMTYYAPLVDTIGPISQNFSITISASLATP